MNGVGFGILTRTPVPQLPLSYPHPHSTRVFNVHITHMRNGRWTNDSPTAQLLKTLISGRLLKQ